MESLPGWVISWMPGLPPRQQEHERRYTPFKQPFIPTRRIWKDNYDGQMIFQDLVGLNLPDICHQVRKNPEKTLPRKPVPTGIEPGSATWQACMLPPSPQREPFIISPVLRIEEKQSKFFWRSFKTCVIIRARQLMILHLFFMKVETLLAYMKMYVIKNALNKSNSLGHFFAFS